MEYAEYLHVRTSLAWHAGVLAAIVLLILALGHQTTFDVNGASKLTSGMSVPLGTLVPIALFFAAIFGSSAGGSLNREFLTHDISWTKPISRQTLALRYVLIDLAAVALVFTLTMLAVVVVLWWIRIAPLADPAFAGQLLLGLGASAMWYAIVQVLTCRLPRRGLALNWILWPVALSVDGLGRAGGLLGTIARTLNILNPLAYPHDPVELVPADLRLLVVWFFAVLFCGIAIAIWSRREA
jgi:hypothetical protein